MILSNLTNENVATIQWGVILGASLVAAFWDLRSHRIPNLLTLPLFVLGLIQAGWLGGFHGWGQSLLGAVILAFPYVLLYLFASGGAGDAKLMAAAGAWLGLENGIIALFCISICAIMLALLKAAFARRFVETLKRILAILSSVLWVITSKGSLKVSDMVDINKETVTVPYGVAIFAGLVSAALYSWVG
jgi:prepilin peptidase CpaA